jgi:poly(beta-D-mannuronate) lyase
MFLLCKNYREVLSIMQADRESKWKILFLFTILMVASIVGALTAQAADYPVSTMTGLNSAIANANPGDTITMSSGTWNNADIVINGNNGTSANPIRLRAALGGGVVLTGTSKLHIGRDYWIVDGLTFENGALAAEGSVIEFRSGSTHANHSRLTNTKVVDYNPADNQLNYRWVSIYGTYNRVDHSYFSGKSHLGPVLAVIRESTDANYAQIDHNYFGDIPVFGGNGAETIRIGTSTYSMSNSNSIVENNLFYMCDGEAEIISVKSGGNKIRSNTILKSKGAITLRHGNNNEVYANVIMGFDVSSTGGVRIIGENHKVYNNYIEGTKRYGIVLSNGYLNSPVSGYTQVINASVVNNTLIGNAVSLQIGPVVNSGMDNLAPKDSVIANNIVQSGTGTLIDQITAPTNMTYAGNIMYGTSLGISPTPSGITISDPQLQLTNEIYSLYRPNAASPAVDAAVSTYSSYITTDMDGQTRLSAKDVGADELSAGTVTERPQSAVDVGPSWMKRYYDINGNAASYIEAEKYTSETGGFTLSTCTSCSSYGYMYTPNGGGGSSSADYMTYNLNVTNGGAFHIYLLATGADTSSDSFNVSVDSGPDNIVNTGTTGWIWKDNSTSGTFNLPAGNHTLYIKYREDGAQIDKIGITKSGTLPTGLGGYPLEPKFEQ